MKIRAKAAAVSAAALLVGMAAAAPAAAGTGGVGAVDIQEAAGCAPMAGAPYRIGTTVKADVTSYGCSNGWTFRATLQSSRWWGWAKDDTTRWFGSTHRVLNDYNCGGEHQHRVALWATSPTGYNYPVHIGKTVTLNCG
ncbi:hypothetical protein FZ103_21400 [Streptomonospora sp. PA3]|uniref:hypothetical protein n=1 Tax=Streptomonospora sp. PA3 TaxID=2607326 RepID=UPI0012DD0E3F|nr:hypothetical protein [Streptomonospora sp. PA3]MUL43687.1 hypothetical protein [Streptomonospora sp. PA3]